MEFRKDINGLRAWAVVLVILFHFGVPGFKGGGIGVDVFFVISGFLMTKIIYKGIYCNNWGWMSLLDFYLARAKRIIPALVVLCVVLLICGYFFLSFSEYRELSKHVISALGFFSNIQFWRESGYFDVASHKKFLLHTWSLSVEWQFYLILPIVLLVLHKIFKKEKVVSRFVFVGFFVSLLLSVILTYKMPSASFYLLPTRAWEMLAGGLVFIFLKNNNFSSREKKFLEILGVFIILGSAVFIDQKDIWPGYLALVPVLGAAMVLASNGQGALTNHEVAQWLGKTSYSLYLWHWPLAVVLVYVGWYGQLIPTAVALLLTILLGWVSWKFIENKSKKILSHKNIKNAYLKISISIIFVCSISLLIFVTDGLKFRNPLAYDIYSERYNRNPSHKECHVSGIENVPECVYGNKDYGVIVVGDSHADAVVRSVEKAFDKKGFGVLDWSLSSCPTIAGVKRDEANYRCGEQVFEFLRKSSEIESKAPILIVNRISAYIEGKTEYELRQGELLNPSYIDEKNKSDKNNRDIDLYDGILRTACEFSKDRKVYMMRPIPEMNENVPVFMEKEIIKGRKDYRVSISLDEYYKRHQLAFKAQDEAAKKCGVTLLDPIPYLCSEGRCWGDHEGRPIYYDDDHLSERGGALLIPLFQKIAQELPSSR